MNNLAIKIENLSKLYRLGVIRAQTLRDDVQRLWWKILGKGDPLLKLGTTNKLNSNNGKDFVWVLKNINLEIEQGEILGIIGRNGAGKSTLLKILSRITLPTIGTIKINGKLGSLLEVGTGFHPELTGRENIYLNGAILGMTRAEVSKKIDDIIDFAGVAQYIDTPVKRYSSGMFVRLGFAVAAFLEPDILVVDEVLAVGDAEFQKKAVGKMKDVSKKGGRTILFVSHNMGSIKNLCTKAILLNKGQITAQGLPEEVISEYLHSIKDANISFGSSLDNYPHNIWIQDHLYVKSINLKNSQNIYTDSIKLFETITVEIDIEVYKKITDGIIVIRFGSLSYGRITYSATDNLKHGEYLTFEPGKYKVILDIEQNLMPGFYNITVSFYDRNGYPYDEIEDYGNFHIENFGQNNELFHWRTIKGCSINKLNYKIVPNNFSSK